MTLMPNYFSLLLLLLVLLVPISHAPRPNTRKVSVRAIPPTLKPSSIQPR